MCDLVKRRFEGHEEITLSGESFWTGQTIYLPRNQNVAEDGLTYPVGCRHFTDGQYTEWEPLPEPGPGEVIEVPPGSELALGIVLDGKFLWYFTDDDWAEWLEATAA